MTDMPTTEVVHEFAVSRWFDAPPSAVFRAWTDPAELEWYLNPEQPRPPQPIEVDLRVGGAWRVPMVIDAETDYITGGIYLEIVTDERLVFAWGAVDGWPKLDLADLEAGPIATLDLLERDGGTEATLTVRLPEHLSAPEVQRWLNLGIRQGWTQTFERLQL
ncbi:SRPBCC domain-containing protein [Microbacterium pumilum]|uniref:Activator of Hsp90 ATPase homologue 1/2-like C-terminal domain-containing protein n=1 Tax=Microbacterium pumilum TaxID=344165 RepID=A0ABN2SAB2_9MICO